MKVVMKIRKTGRKFFDWFGENKLYFMRGYNQYFQLPISLINSSAILYYLVVDNMTGVPDWFRYYVFVAIFLNTIILFGWSMGKFDYKKGTFNQEQKTFAGQSPIWKEHFANQKRLEEKLDKLLEERK